MSGNPQPPLGPHGGVSAGDGPQEYIRPGENGSREISPPQADLMRQVASLEGLESLIESALSSPRCEEALRRALRVAVTNLGARWGWIWNYETATERLRIVTTVGADSAAGEDPVSLGTAAAERAIDEMARVRDRIDEPGTGRSEILALPIAVLGAPVGAIAVCGKKRTPEQAEAIFDGADERFLKTVAMTCGMVMHQGRLSEDLREAERRLEEIQRMLLQSERLAALGEMSAKVAHEIRNPLSGIGGFARRIEKGLPADDPNRQYAAIVVREIARLESILNEQLLFAQRSHPRLSVVDLGALARETVHLVREEAEAKGVRILEQYQGNVKPMLLDGDRVKQVILNILKNAIASTRQGNRIRLATRSTEGWAQVEIANDGERLPGEILDSLFVPFATARNRGCGLGLAVADQIVKEHGGEIRVRSSEEWSVLFVVSLPILGNAERRRSPERRRGRERRRAA